MPSPSRPLRKWLWLVSLAVVLKQINSFSATASQQYRYNNADILPPALQEAASLGLLVQPNPNLYVLGTVHIGSKSADEAALLIKTLKPSAVVVEVSPSRLKSIRSRRVAQASNSESSTSDEKDLPKGTRVRTLLALAEKGWSTGGIGGLLFATLIMGGSLVKRSFTAKEEADTLPRVDEFAAAIAAADDVKASVVACDSEIDDFISDIVRSISPLGLISLGTNIAAETLGLRGVDPIRRRRGETIVEWSTRRRDISTARASKLHGEQMSRELSTVLVDNRDKRFARYCEKVKELLEDTSSTGPIVCVVGLVHLDGIDENLME